jgi:hypothetical protein
MADVRAAPLLVKKLLDRVQVRVAALDLMCVLDLFGFG